MNEKTSEAVGAIRRIYHRNNEIDSELEKLKDITQEIADFKVLRASYAGSHCFIDIEDPKSDTPKVVPCICIFNIYEELYGNDSSRKMSLEDLEKGLHIMINRKSAMSKEEFEQRLEESRAKSIMEGKTEIKEFAFESSKLKKIVIPNGITKIGRSAFMTCTSLECIDIPNSVKEIGRCAFVYCISLNEVVIPDGVTKIEQGTFADCDNLRMVAIPDSVTTIGKASFLKCWSLKSLILPPDLTEIGARAFKDCSSLTDIYYMGSKEQWAAIRKGEAWCENIGTRLVECCDGEAEIQ